MKTRMSHAVERAKERYGLDVTDADLTTLCGELRDNLHVLQGHTGDGQFVWLAKIGGKVARVVTNKRINAVITFLPASSYRLPRDGGNRKRRKGFKA